MTSLPLGSLRTIHPPRRRSRLLEGGPPTCRSPGVSGQRHAVGIVCTFNAPKRRSLHIDAATFVAMKYIPADPLTCLDVTSPSTSIISPKTVALQFSLTLNAHYQAFSRISPARRDDFRARWAADQTQAVYVRGTYLMLSLREVKEVLLIPVIASSQRRAN